MVVEVRGLWRGFLCGGKRERNVRARKRVELDEELEVDVVALGSFAVCATHMMSVEVDTCRIALGSASVPY